MTPWSQNILKENIKCNDHKYYKQNNNCISHCTCGVSVKKSQDDNTIFAGPLKSKNSNSMNCDETDSQNHFFFNDFIGGPIEGEENRINLINHTFNTQSVDNRPITCTPADSSCEFHNTFSVLERHLINSNCQRLIEYLLLMNNDLEVHNDTHIKVEMEHPMKYHQTLCSFSRLPNTIFNDSKSDDDLLSDFKIEFEASNMQNVSDSKCEYVRNESNDNTESLSSPFDSSLVETLYQQDDTNDIVNSNGYIYHVARARTGHLYIRVRRNLHSDRGKLIALGWFNCYQ